MIRQLRSLMDHVVGARFPVPQVLYNSFEAWRFPLFCDDGGKSGELQRRFAAVYVQVARGGSVRCAAGCPHPPTSILFLAGSCLRSTLRRDALRTQFPTLLITREVAHAFAAAALRDCARCFSGTLRTAAADKLPFRALRVAQLHALGMDIFAACFVAELLLPLAPCAADGAERLLMDAARFLLQSGLVPTAHLPEAALLDGYVQLRASRDALADLGFSCTLSCAPPPKRVGSRRCTMRSPSPAARWRR
jgi:hypothetical protein